MQYQLRMYDVRPGAMDDFIAVFRRIVEVRRAAGFTVVGAWADRDADRFVWMVGYDGADGFAAAERRYYDAPERAAIEPDPRTFITNVVTEMLTAVPLP